jgi:DNA-directed RNA polymerase specialized sigma subunit
LYYTHFDALGEKCRQILQWFFDKTPLKEIAKRLDTSEGYIKKRKFQCKKQLIEAIQSDAKFKELSAF